MLLPRNCYPKLKQDYEKLGFHNFVDATLTIGGTTLSTFVSEAPAHTSRACDDVT